MANRPRAAAKPLTRREHLFMARLFLILLLGLSFVGKAAGATDGYRQAVQCLRAHGAHAGYYPYRSPSDDHLAWWGSWPTSQWGSWWTDGHHMGHLSARHKRIFLRCIS